MADARFFTFSSSFQTLFRSQKLIQFPSKRGFCSTFKISGSPKTSSSPSQHIVSRDFDIVSTKEKSDGSVVFHFGEASEILENVEPVISPKIDELEITGEEVVTCPTEEVDSQNELVDSVKLVDLSAKDITLSEDDFGDVKSNPGSNVLLVSPVNKAALEDVVKDRNSGTDSDGNFTTSAVSPGLDIVSSKDLSRVEGENEVAIESTEFDVEVHASFASQAGKSESVDLQDMDISLQTLEPNYSNNDEGVEGINKVVLASNSLETETVNEQLTNMAVDKEPSKAPTLYEELTEDPLGTKLVHDALDEEPAELPTDHIVDVESVAQQTHQLVDEEPTHQTMVKEVAEQPTPSAADEESVHDEGIESMNMIIDNVIDQQSTEVVEELNHHGQDDELDYNQGVQSLKLLDEKLPSSICVEEIAKGEGDSQSSSEGDVSISLATGFQPKEDTMTMEETSPPRIFLFSGAASLPHPSKVQKMLILFMKTGSGLLMVLDNGHLKGIVLDCMARS